MKYLCCIFTFAILLGCNNQQNQKAVKLEASNAAAINFMGKDTVNLGQITEGELISHTYQFTNTGKAPLQINYCNASCGCTVPTWPKKPIPTGGKDSITVQFNSKNKSGKLYKSIAIHANTIPNITNIGFSIEVLPKIPL
jgi:hypothetical protein